MKSDLICGDCLQEMPKLETGSIDLILTDLPYGVTHNAADICLPLDKLWREWKRILKPSGIVVLTSQFPYTLDLILSNRSWFRYDLIWDKQLVTGFLNANRMPLRVHEHILVFYETLGKFYPQKSVGPKNHGRGNKLQFAQNNYGEHKEVRSQTSLKFPSSIISIQKPINSKSVHITEKPVELAEYLIKSYTAEGDTVLDCCMGVGWSAVASKRHNRNYVGIEINPSYFYEAKRRVAEIPAMLNAFLVTPQLLDSVSQRSA